MELDKSIFRGRVIKVCVTARRGGGVGVGQVARTHSCLALCQSLVFGHICWTAASFLTQTPPAGGDAGLTEAVAGPLWLSGDLEMTGTRLGSDVSGSLMPWGRQGLVGAGAYGHLLKSLQQGNPGRQL